MPVVLSVYGGLGLGLALNPTPNPYRKPQVSKAPISGAGVPDEHNEAIPNHNVINTHTHTFANVAQQSPKRFSKLFRLQCCYGSNYGNSRQLIRLQFRFASKYGFSEQYL